MATLALPVEKAMHGAGLLHLDREYDEIVRAIGKEYGATLIEAGQVLAHNARLYLDLCHPDEPGDRITATLLSNAIDGLLQDSPVTAEPVQLKGT